MQRSTETLKAFLLSCNKETLVKLVLEASDADAQFNERLVQLEGQAQGKPTDLSRYRDLIARACHSERFVEYKHVPEFAKRIENSLRPIAQMLRDGQPAEALPLIDSAIEHVCRAFRNCHDDLGQVCGIIKSLSSQHLAACRLTRPDARGLARVLFKREWRDHNGLFTGLLEKYTEVLASQGLEAYYTNLRTAWRNIPVIKDPHGFDGGRSNLQAMIRTFARVADRPELIAQMDSGFAARQNRALPRIEQQVHDLVLGGKQRDYAVAVDLLKQLHAILKEHGMDTEWTALLKRVETRHHRKSIFMRALIQATANGRNVSDPHYGQS